jgi:hypothetical protein
MPNFYELTKSNSVILHFLNNLLNCVLFKYGNTYFKNNVIITLFIQNKVYIKSLIYT